MKSLYILLLLLFLTGCGGGGSGSSTTIGPDGVACTSGAVSYSTSQPLVDNSDTSAYRVLLMGNSHAHGLRPTLEQLLNLGQPGKSVTVEAAPGLSFLAERVNDGSSEQLLECGQWSHVVLQAQKYSSTGTRTYPTTAAEYFIRGIKELGATSIMFPEHPRRGNSWEGQTLWELHSGIADRENTCVAPVGLVWDEVKFRDPFLNLHKQDGNHASDRGLLLTALVFYPIITGESVDTLPSLAGFNIDAATEQIMKESVSSLLFTHVPCEYDPTP